MSSLFLYPSHPNHLDDEIVALSLQLEEINYRNEISKSKYSTDKVPDLEIAYASFLSDLETQLAFLKDVKLAHSIATAVDADAKVLSEISQEEVRAQEDRRVALQMSADDPDLEAPPPYTEEVRNEFLEDEIARRFAELLSVSESFEYEPESHAGPSTPYAQRQASALKTLSEEKLECCSCRGDFRLNDTTKLECKHMYCNTCLKRVIMRGVLEKDLNLLPPRCCGNHIPFSVIARHLSEEEIEMFQNAEVEKATVDKTYCSGSDCGTFIAPVRIKGRKATCQQCQHETCAMCKNSFHDYDCPEDPDIQPTLDLAQTLHWRRCFSCRALVSLDMGCNHMRCRCGAEFCYSCGAQWKSKGRKCGCPLWLEENLIQRAEQVVDRRMPDLAPAQRNHHVLQVQEDLRDVDDCDHVSRRKFTQVEGGGRAGFRCEMCNDRHWKFILQCKRCELRLCMDCRRNRV
ncbi:hypothetical protein B0J11DRAFT_444628 [Dendryphion nanum]|uniref:RBR-type E3 ubiquitin transferase n=1 Tax=Dendryphion nanum TaxID=256645 RepID=A0A9P9D9J3_9PLEO|nr:hypothetical protein B0J11DRAFT_444628 [Dendryphion nanum]